MYQRILVPTDGSEITAKAIDTAVALAKLSGATMTTRCVKEPFPYSAISEMQPVPPQEFYDAQERIATDRVKAVMAAASAAGVVCRASTVEPLQTTPAALAWSAAARRSKPCTRGKPFSTSPNSRAVI